MKNITVSVPDEVYHAARVKAAQERTSLSAVVREKLTAYSNESVSDERRQSLREFLDEFRLSRANGPHFDPAENLTREELHDRALHRHERSRL